MRRSAEWTLPDAGPRGAGGGTGPSGGEPDAGPAAAVLEEITQELAALLGDGVDPGDVRVEVDVFEGREPLVAGRWLDSMDLVQVVAALEDRFDVPLATVLTGDEPMTLSALARHIARHLPGSPT